jgi:hypothetical protein
LAGVLTREGLAPMTFPPLIGWLLAAIAVVGVVWTLLKSVHVNIKVRVRRVTPGEAPPADDAEPIFSFHAGTHFDQGKAIHFGTRKSP